MPNSLDVNCATLPVSCLVTKENRSRGGRTMWQLTRSHVGSLSTGWRNRVDESGPGRPTWLTPSEPGEHYWPRVLGRRALVAEPVRQIGPTIGQIPSNDAFPEQPVGFIHDLTPQDGLTLDAIAALADRLPRSVIFDTAAQPLLVPEGGPPRGALARPGDVIRNLRSANAWLTLLDVQEDPAWADLMNTKLDQLELGIIHRQGKMRNRSAFIFVSSPNSVTPVHFDVEHSLLMQVSGSKTVSVGSFENDAARRYEVDRYWDGSHGRMKAVPTGHGYLSIDAGTGGLPTTWYPTLGP